jgi:cytochrome c biogenesis protein CcmG, thiol:disulfide interchange protein DsbE
MKRFLILFSFLLWMEAKSFAAELDLSKFQVQSLQNPQKTIDLSKYKDRYVIVDLWASWCAPCRESFKFYNELVKQYPELIILAVAMDQNREDSLKFIKENQVQFLLGYDLDLKLRKALDIQSLPQAYLYGPGFQFLEKHKGFNKKVASSIEDKLAKALKVNKNK